MLKWIPFLLAATLVLFSGCKKSEPVKTEPMVDTSAVLPEPPELDPIEDAFPQGEPAVSPDNASAKPATKPVKKTTKTTEIKGATIPGTAAAGLSKTGAYTLQIGIYNTESLARKRAEALKTKGFPAYVARVENPTADMIGTYYRVRLGSFATTAAARAYGEENLTPAGIAFWADLKSRDSRSVGVKPQTFKSEYETRSPAKPVATAAPVPAPPPPSTPTPPAPAPAAASPAPPANTESAGDTKPAPKLPDW
jgi:hypothetical protein